VSASTPLPGKTPCAIAYTSQSVEVVNRAKFRIIGNTGKHHIVYIIKAEGSFVLPRVWNNQTGTLVCFIGTLVATNPAIPLGPFTSRPSI